MLDRGDQWQRWYRLTLGDLQITSEGLPRPLNICFAVEVDDKFVTNNCELEVYGLNETTRSFLSKTEDISVQLEAGYVNGAQSTIFLGALRHIDIYKDGEGHWVSRISSGDAEKELLRQANVEFPKGTSYGKVFKTLVEKLGVKPGNVDSLASVSALTGATTLERGYVASGSVANELRWFAATVGIEWSIQQGVFVGQFAGRAAASGGPKISTRTGLVGDPKVDAKGKVSGRALLQPGLLPCTAFELASYQYSGALICTQVKFLGDFYGQEWYCDWEGKNPDAKK